MLFQRILGALEFRREVYQEVEHDASFTTTAWILVVVSGFLNQLGAQVSSNVGNWLIRAVIGTVIAVLGFALAAALVERIGRGLFGAQVTFQQMVRTLGLASIWRAVGLVAALAAVSTALTCIAAPVWVVAAILAVIASFIAAKEALDLEWGRTIASVLLGWLLMIGISIGTRFVFEALGFGAGALGWGLGF